MSPDRPPHPRGPERRRGDRRHEDRWSITPWRAATLASFIVSIVLAAGLYTLLGRVETNTNRATQAICFEISYLKQSIPRARALSKQLPKALRRAQAESIKRSEALIKAQEMAISGDRCPRDPFKTP